MASVFTWTSHIDAVDPTIVAVRSLDKNTIEVVFSEPPLQYEAMVVTNYVLTGGIDVEAIENINATSYRLTVTDLDDVTSYDLTVSNIHDRFGNLI